MKVLGILALSCALVPLSPLETRPSDEASVVRRLASPAAEPALHWALVGARRRLEQPACQRLFAGFSDASGQTLQANLDALGRAGADHLGLIRFTDGSDRRGCKGDNTFAFTTPGSREVYVCGRAFRELAKRDPPGAQALIIHELLHTLGLGENPPSSLEITKRVRATCG
jgi:hypothetical protein